MKIFSIKTLKQYGEEYHQAKENLLAWNKETEKAEWNNPNELKERFPNASILGNQRVVFNIHGNCYRLIVYINYNSKKVFIIWFGTHKAYHQIDAKTVKYVKTHKN